jgi:hypothetical protein
MARAKRDIKFQVLLTPNEVTRLEQLAQKTGFTKSLALRRALLSFHAMECRCPQFVTRAQAPAQTSALFDDAAAAGEPNVH